MHNHLSLQKSLKCSTWMQSQKRCPFQYRDWNAKVGSQGVSGPLLSCVWNLRVFPEMHDGDSAPSCCAFTHWVAFEEVSGPRVLFKSGQGNRGLSAWGTTHGASLKSPSEASFILSCAGKAGDPSRQCRGIDSPVAIRRGEGAQMKWGWNPRCYPRGKPAQNTVGGGGSIFDQMWSIHSIHWISFTNTDMSNNFVFLWVWIYLLPVLLSFSLFCSATFKVMFLL